MCTLLPQFRGLQRTSPIDKVQDMIDGVNGDSDLHRHHGGHRHCIVIVFHCCCCFDAGAASGQLFMHGLVTLPLHLFQNKSLTLSVTFNIIVKRLFLNFEQLQLMLSYEHWQSTTTANSKQISHSQCCCQHSFQIVVNFKRFAFAVFTLDLI